MCISPAGRRSSPRGSGPPGGPPEGTLTLHFIPIVIIDDDDEGENEAVDRPRQRRPGRRRKNWALKKYAFKKQQLLQTNEKQPCRHRKPKPGLGPDHNTRSHPQHRLPQAIPYPSVYEPASGARLPTPRASASTPRASGEGLEHRPSARSARRVGVNLHPALRPNFFLHKNAASV